MFDLILNSIVFSALLFVAVSLEKCPPARGFPGRDANCMCVASRYLIVALAAFPWIAFARLRAGGSALQRAGAKLLSCSGVLSGRPYLSDIFISACVSIVFLGWLAARRLAQRRLRRTVKLAATDGGTESEGSFR